MTFPLANTTSQTYDYNNCEINAVTLSAYAPATPSATPPYYTVVPLSSDYKTSDTNGLNGGTSDAVKAVDWADGAGCPAQSNKYGLESPYGPYDTYFASAISPAQANLSALANPRASMQSAIILLSDGDATALWSTTGGQMDFTPSTPQRFSQNECHQAIVAGANAAQTANSAGLTTWVYSIAYASSTWAWRSSRPNSSCKTDTSAYGGNNSGLTGCSTMQQIASDPNKFYNDQGAPSDGSPPCNVSVHTSLKDLSQIFSAIAGDFYTTQLLPWGTT